MSRNPRCTRSEHTRDKRGACAECQRATRKRWRENNPEKYRAYHREKWRQAAGLPTATHPDPGVCEVCTRQNKDGRVMALDHDHATGEFRGWLCYLCNTGIGNLGDNIAGLEKALAYLKRAQK